jgi:transposase-like protein
MPVTMDGKGRVRTTREQRQLILAEFARSGVSGVQFAQRAGLKYSTLAGWLQRYRRSKPRGPRPGGENAEGGRRSNPKRDFS